MSYGKTERYSDGEAESGGKGRPGNRIVIFKRVARIGLIEKVILKQKSEEGKELAQWLSEGSTFHAEGRTLSKDLCIRQ